MDETYDVVVIGGGAAGLAGAMTLARARRTVLVVDAGEPRNAPAGHVHNYLGREGTPPQELLSIGREEVTGYGGEVVRGTVAALRSTGAGEPAFEVTLDDGRALQARRLLVATGLADELPDVPGVAQRWGRDVLHCPYCHGWEVRDQRIGVLATGPMATHQAMLFRQLSADVVLLAHTGPTPGEDELEQLSARGVRRIDGEVECLEVREDRLTGARLRSGELVPLDAVVVAPVFRARADLLAGLGIQPTPMLLGEHVMGSYVAADPMGATTVSGVWVAGNVASARAQVLSSAAAGLDAGAAINADLVAEDAARAVAQRRRGEVHPAQGPRSHSSR